MQIISGQNISRRLCSYSSTSKAEVSRQKFEERKLKKEARREEKLANRQKNVQKNKVQSFTKYSILFHFIFFCRKKGIRFLVLFLIDFKLSMFQKKSIDMIETNSSKHGMGLSGILP